MANLVDRFTIQMQLYGASQVSNQLLNIANRANGVANVNFDRSRLLSGLKVFAGLGLVDFLSETAKAAVKTSFEFQQMNRQLSVVFDTAAGGKEAFEWAKKFARDTPFEVEEVIKAMTSLGIRGIQPTIRNMKMFGAVAKLFGFDFDYIARAVASAGHGRFHSLTYVAGITKADVPANLWDKSGKAKDFQAVIEAITKILETRIPDAMTKLQMQTSTKIGAMHDMWKEFLNASFGESGLEQIGRFADWMTFIFKQLALAVYDFKNLWDSAWSFMGQGIADTAWVLQHLFPKDSFFGKVIEHFDKVAERIRNMGKEARDNIKSLKDPNMKEPPSIRNSLLKKGGDSAGGGGSPQWLKEIIGGGYFTKRGILPSEMPGIAARRTSNVVRIKLETTQGKDFQVALEHIIQKAVEGLLRHGAIQPAGA